MIKVYHFTPYYNAPLSAEARDVHFSITGLGDPAAAKRVFDHPNSFGQYIHVADIMAVDFDEATRLTTHTPERHWPNNGQVILALHHAAAGAMRSTAIGDILVGNMELGRLAVMVSSFGFINLDVARPPMAVESKV